MSIRTSVVLSLSLGAVVSVGLLARDARAACPKLDCGSNSPYLSQFSFHELNFEGLPNAQGLRVTGMEFPGVWWPHPQLYPRVDRDVLLAVDDHGEIWFTGEDLTGGIITIVTSDPQPRKFELRIDRVFTGFDLWVDPEHERLESYKLSWAEVGAPGQDMRPLCVAPPAQTFGDGQEWHPDPDGTILFTGNRYDARHKEVTEMGFEETRGWVNFACLYGAAYKLHQTRETLVTSNEHHKANRDEQQAGLKMYVSDVCGTGNSFTYQGVPLRWTNALGWGSVDWTEWGTEAYWGPQGALCLDTHRLGPQFMNAIVAECHLPTCDTAFPGAFKEWPAEAYMLSRLPVDPN